MNSMKWTLLAKPLAGLLCILGCLTFAPGIVAAIENSPTTLIFFLTGLCALLCGATCWYFLRNVEGEISNKMGFAVVTFSWIIACTYGALPFYFSGTLPYFLDAFFESASGFSGTGASVLTDIEAVDAGVLFWRSMTQWLGGMGIIVFFIAILPLLGIGGVQLFRAEATGPQKDRITPRVRDTAKSLWLLYFGFTLLLTMLLMFCGVSLYDSLNHAMTTMATGGFSTKNLGAKGLNSIAAEYIIATFMLLGSISFSLHFRLLVLKDRKVFQDTELRSYLAIVFGAIIVLTGVLWDYQFNSLEYAFRHAFFTITATSSTTGFTHSDYLGWPVFSHYIIILLMVMGGMSGSTAGGMKCIRLVAAFKLLSKELQQVIHPNAVLTVKTNERSIRQGVISAIWGFLFLYLFVFSVISAVLVYEGLDLVTAATATFSALSNVGPALGKLGPFDNYSALSSI
ncbi:MAG: hypothetical protein KDD62_12950, partial [Bdellovibrionales bacterium]|nr:hypothetical protein [Bdellovibrionales bacterium]